MYSEVFLKFIIFGATSVVHDFTLWHVVFSCPFLRVTQLHCVSISERKAFLHNLRAHLGFPFQIELICQERLKDSQGNDYLIS